MKCQLSVIKKGIILFLIVLISIFLFQACKKKRCPDDIPEYVKNYASNYSTGKVIVYKNQYNDLITLPASRGIISSSVYNRPHTTICEVSCNVSTENNDSLFFNLNIQGNINSENYYNYIYYIGLGNNDVYKKYFDFFYLDGPKPGGYPVTNSNDSIKYYDNYLINGINYPKVFQVILTDSSRAKPFYKQYFLNHDKGFIRFDEKYSDKIWVLN